MNVLKDRKINIKSLPGYGNAGLKKKEIVNKNKSEGSIKLSAQLVVLHTIFLKMKSVNSL